MRKSVILLLLCLAVSAFAQCGPAQCYNGCTDARVPVDIVFIIDVSGSMQSSINGVRNGLTQFASDLRYQSVIPAYSVILYGDRNDRATLRLNAEQNFGTFKQLMDSITVDGGWEPAFESIRRAANTAGSGNFGINYRSGARKVFIVLTDEDSDPAYLAGNRFQRSGNDGREQCSVDFSEYQNEINSVAQSIQGLGASTYLLTAFDTSSSFRTSQTCLTKRQFGDYNLQSQSQDWKTFNAQTTLTNLRNAGLGSSLQAKLLENGLLCRNFFVGLAGDPTFVKNFFEGITADISKCDRTCLRYDCSPQNTCLPPVNICGCDGVPNSGRTTDAWGGCCLPSERDCTGRCFGKSTYDPDCGVCTAGVRPSTCITECGKTYLTQKPTVAYITREQIDAAGYLLMNKDLYDVFISPSGSLQWLYDHYHQFGRFEGRQTCTFDGTETEKQNWLNALRNSAINPKPAAKCVFGTKTKLTFPTRDACNQCITFTDNPPYCVSDCTNTLRTNPNQAYFVDECGKCVAPGTSPSANKDDCGVCFGKNADKNQCLECFGSKALDQCNQPVCRKEPCSKECDGVSRPSPTKKVDECGFCVLISQGRDPKCIQDCGGIYYDSSQPTTSIHIIDECLNCVKRTEVRKQGCVQDCSGKWNGTAFYDKCNQCIDGKDDFTCIQDCDGNYYRQGKDTPIKTVDECGECNTPANQNKLKDRCGKCTNSYNSTAECIPDCKGIYYLKNDPNSKPAFIDLFCAKCWFANETNLISGIVDDCGQCVLGGSSDPNWNKDRAKDSFGNVCPCLTPANVCSYPNGTTFQFCLDCPTFKVCPQGGSPDSCGLCPGKSMYGKKDKCGVCCSPEDGVPCDVDIDSCGKCFGFDKDRDTNACKVCDAKTCVVDCSGKANGTAKVGCDGVCGSTASCLSCGDGVISPEIGETCDLGNGKNTKGSGCFNCQTESGNSTGSIVGGVIGGIAAVAFLGVAAFLAFQYAKKNGLIGKSGQKLDLSASNANPLYKSDTNIQQNPLYGN